MIDASIQEQLMATHWVLTILEQEIELEGGVESKAWGEGLIAIGEATGTLDLIKYIVQRSKNIPSSEVVIYTDNKTVLKEVYRPINKESDVTGEVGTTITAIRETMDAAMIDISIEYSNDKLRPGKTFVQQPGAILMKKYDLESKKKRQMLE